MGFWTALVELLTPPTEFGGTRCFSNVFGWAEDSQDFAAKQSRHLESEGVTLLEIERTHRVSDNEEFPEETAPFVDWIRQHPGEFTTADRHYYPSKPI